jgi:hypothetical protein
MTRLTSRSMRYLRYILQTVNWQRLRPEPGRILNQPGAPDRNMVLSYDGSSALLAYLPAEPASIQIDFGANGTLYRAVPGLSTLTSKQQFLQSGWVYRWFSPRSGNTPSSPDVLYISPGKFQFIKPTTCDHDPIDVTCDQNDWVLRLTKTGGPQPPVPGFAASHLEVSNEIGSASGNSTVVAQRIDEELPWVTAGSRRDIRKHARDLAERG